MEYTEELEAAVKEGKMKRMEKVGSPKGKAKKELEEVQLDWKIAEDGLQLMVGLLKMRKSTGRPGTQESMASDNSIQGRE